MRCLLKLFVASMNPILMIFLSPPLHQRLVTIHAEYPLRCSSIFQIFDLLLAIPTFETIRAECLIACEYCKVFDFVPTHTATICTVVADERAVTEKEEIGIRVEDGSTSVASKAIDMPSIAR